MKSKTTLLMNFSNLLSRKFDSKRVTNSVAIWLTMLLTVLMSTNVWAQAAATVTTDKADYAPGETVQITGANWQPGEVVYLIVNHYSIPIPDHGGTDPHQTWEVVADSLGHFNATWDVSKYEIGAKLLLIAVGQQSGFTFEVFFTDGNVAFGQIGVPGSNIDMTVSVNYTKTDGTSVTGEVFGFKSNGTVSVAVKDNTTISWVFNPVTISTSTYTSNSSNYEQNFNIGTSNWVGSNAVRGVYIACIAPAITSATSAASPICASATTTVTANGVVGTGALVTWFTGAGGTGDNLGTGSSKEVGPGTYYARVTGDCGTAVEASVTVGAFGTTITSGAVGGSATLTQCDGGNPSSFTVGTPTGGNSTYAYQWEQSENCTGIWINADAEDGGATNTLTFNPPVLNTTICYRLKITDGCGSVGYSATKTYNVVPDPTAPGITKDPNVTTVCAGQMLTVTTTPGTGGTGTIKDEYRYNNGSGFSAWTINVPNFAAVVGTNTIESRRTATGTGCNNSPSNSVSWTVAPQPVGSVIAKVPTDATVCSGATLTISVTTPGSGGTGTSQDEYRYSTNNGTSWSDWGTSLPSFAAVTGTNTVESRRTSTGTGCTTAAGNSVSWSVNPNAAITSVTGGTSPLCIGATTTVTANGVVLGGGSGAWSSSNELVATVNSSGLVTAIGAGTANIIYTVTGCNGTPSAFQAIVVKQVPLITAQPVASQTICLGTSVTFTVAADSRLGGALSYQWKKAGIDIATATSSSYTISAVALTDAATYTVVVTNSCGSVTSSDAVLVVKQVPLITAQPAASQTICLGSPVTFTVAADSRLGGALSYQWKKAGVDIATATSASYTISAVALTDAATYTVVVTNSCGSVTSSDAVLVVKQVPLITAQPAASQTICLGTSVTFSVTADSRLGGTLSYQWKKDGVNVGSTSASYTISAVALTDAATYTVVVTNSCGDVTSSNAVLAVSQVPLITAQPAASQTICLGTSVTFTVTADSRLGGTLNYQWKKDGVDIATATSASYTISSVALADAATYTVVVTNSCGSVTSSDAVLAVSQVPLITTQPLTQPVCEKGSLTLTVVADTRFGGTLSYQWKKGGVSITDATSASYTISDVALTDAGSYTVVVTNSCGTVTSNAAIITVRPATAITKITIDGVDYTAPITFNYGCKTPLLRVFATGYQIFANPLRYQWYKNDVAITGAVLPIYNVPPATDAGTYTYKVVVAGYCGTAQSSVTVIITQQPANADLDADSYYTGPNVAWTPTATSNTASVTLSAFLKNSTAVDAECGDISTARVTFKLNGTNIPSATNLPVNFVDPNNPAKGGTAAAIVQLSIPSNASSEIFDITVVISGNYKAEEVQGTVSQILVGKLVPGGAIGGGAKLTHLFSTGFVKGALSRKTVATFGVEYTVKGKTVSSPKGRVTLMIPSYNDKNGNPTSTLHWYFVKSNAISALAITSPTATFTSKANIGEWDPVTGVLTPIEGNCTMVLDMGDYSDKPKNFLDKVGVTVHRNAGGIWYSNNWVSGKTVPMNIFGDDVSVTGSTSSARASEPGTTTTTVTQAIATDALEVEAQIFNVMAYPNPSTAYFTLKLQGATQDQVQVNVFDVNGRQVYTKIGNYNDNYQFGERFQAGIYLVNVQQGTNKVSLKVIKQ
ncbi:MAG: T9SS type A sorting domain-containing protein [Flavobacteriaceae bacterium]|nr:T9SS type A sorting domain-containing protein [Flavobacteriaceae bacterium]